MSDDFFFANYYLESTVSGELRGGLPLPLGTGRGVPGGPEKRQKSKKKTSTVPGIPLLKEPRIAETTVLTTRNRG